MSMTTVKTPINKDFEPDHYPTQTRKGDTVSLYSNELLLASTMDQKKSHRKGVPGGDWNQENDTRFANIAKVSGEFVSDKVYTSEEISKGQWKHEEKLVLDLIQPGGARSCPSDQVLQEFAKASEFLEPAVLGSILIHTLRDSQVSSNNKAKAVCGIDSLIRSHNKYRRYFNANTATLEGLNLTDNETVVKDLISTVVQNLKSGKPGREMLKRAQTTVITTPKPDVDLMNFDDTNLGTGDKTTKSKFGFIRSSNVATPLNAVTPMNGSGVLDLMSLDVSMTAPTPERTPNAILSLYQQQELQQPQPQQINGRMVPVIPPLHTMGAFLWDDVQTMQGHQLESSSGPKPASTKKMDAREQAFDFIKF